MRPRCLSFSTRGIEQLWIQQRSHSRIPASQRHLFLLLRQRSNFSSTASTANNEQSKTPVAVIGGGITGLAAAHHLAKDKSLHVTLYEGSDRLGGWLGSETIEVDGNGHVLFEYGPRTLKSGAAALSAIELIHDLGLEKEVLYTSVHDAASRNRYIYYPDHLVRLPGPHPGAGKLINMISNIMPAFSEPVIKQILWAAIMEPFRPVRDKSIVDESVADFAIRRFGLDATDNVASAVFHGIYAGDIYRLSAKTLLSQFWREEIASGGIFRALMEAKATFRVPYDIYHAQRITNKERGMDWIKSATKRLKGASVFALKGGMQQLVDTLDSSLSDTPNVDIKMNSRITHIARKDSALQIQTSDNSSLATYTHVISTTPALGLQRQTLPALANTEASRVLSEMNYAVNVMVVNLFFRSPNLIPVHGFGYLIPRSIPFDQNPERALGVIFMSDSNVGQDTAQGTKLTVMMGGHWWDGWQESDLPDEQSAIEMARSLLERHLQITEEPMLAKAKMMKDAIPQYTVGHTERMKSLHHSLGRELPGLKVAGAWYTGVGVNDCVRAGRLAAHAVSSDRKYMTGLERYLDEKIDGYEVLKP